ncbi:MAG: hypothetical protein WCG23_05800 [bacterium]
MKKIDFFIYWMLALILYLVCNNAYNTPFTIKDSPENQEMAKTYNFENLKDPEQCVYYSFKSNPIRIEKNDYKLKLYPQANYRIYAMVMSKNRYIWGWDGEVAPYDLALAWNKLMLPENQKGISYTQSNRWYYYQYDKTFTLSPSYIVSHSANHHIIPANKNVFNAIDKVRTGEKIYMEGYLVYISGTVGNGNIHWNSSLTRDDSGDGACEVFYVKRAILDGKIYD